MKRVAKYALPLAAITTAGFDEAAIAGDIFLKMEPIEGESVDEKHAGEIDVLAWSWGLNNPAVAGGGGPPTQGSASFSDIKIIKSFDASSPHLLMAIAAGTKFDDAIISVNRATQSGPEEYLTIQLTDVLITKVAQGGKTGEPGVAETVTLAFSKVEIGYTLSDAKGGSTTINSCWDISQNKGC